MPQHRSTSEPDAEGPPKRAQVDARSHPSPQPAAITEALDPARMRQQDPSGGAKPREHMPAARQRNAHTHALDNIASVHDGGFEHAPSDSERSELEAMDDAARDPDEDDDADPHADGNPGCTPRPRREQHERGVIAGESPGRRSKRHGDHGRSARSEHEPPRPQADPSRGPLAFPRNRGLA